MQRLHGGLILNSDKDGQLSPFAKSDYHYQLVAIGALLNVADQAQEKLEEEIEQADTFARQSTGRANYDATDRWVELVHTSVFQESARSMAAVGMLAPLIESVLRAVFEYIKDPLPRSNIIDNVRKRVNRHNMEEYMPVNWKSILDPLFRYRNMMFHHGFEWPKGEAELFNKTLINKGWYDTHFYCATINDKPWVFYMTPGFIDRCFHLCVDLVDGLEQYCDDRPLHEGD